MSQKPGWQTSELWITAGANVIALLALGGVFENADMVQVTDNFTQAVGGIFGVIANVVYIWSRTRIKQTPPETGNTN